MYQDLFIMLSDFIYGQGAVLDEFQTLVMTELSTIGCLFIVSLPFLVTWRVIKLFVR